MFKINESIVYIDGKNVHDLKNGDICSVRHIFPSMNCLSLNNSAYLWSINSFISQKEYRKQKLNKICSK